MTTVHALERPLEAILARENLQRAWQRVKANKGAAGVDAISVTDFPAWARQHWPTIKQQVLKGDYQPEAVRRVWIPKPNGDKRPLGIPNVTDRIIQTLFQPPSVDPHARWCGEGRRDAGPYPISRLHG